jgi:hypothetical protein
MIVNASRVQTLSIVTNSHASLTQNGACTAQTARSALPIAEPFPRSFRVFAAMLAASPHHGAKTPHPFSIRSPFVDLPAPKT